MYFDAWAAPLKNGKVISPHSLLGMRLIIHVSMRFSNKKETGCLLLLNVGFEPGVTGAESPAN